MKKRLLVAFSFILLTSFALACTSDSDCGARADCSSYGVSDCYEVVCNTDGLCEDQISGSCCAAQSPVVDNSCDDSQVIMKLSDDTNAHVSLWNQGSATTDICFDEIFGTASVDSNPHGCTGDNNVLNLYDVSDSHASTTADATYNQEVCFGNLNCRYVDGASCGANEELVARLYRDYNSHAATASGTYNVGICCAASDAYWTNTNGERITEAEFGDTVLLVKSYAASAGNFEIKENDPVADDNIRIISSSSVAGPHVIAQWTISQEDLDATESGDYDEFYFEVDGLRSDYLAIDPNGDDSEIDLEIVNPICGRDVNAPADVRINISAADDDDIIQGNVSINGVPVAVFSNGGIVFDHTFSVAGNSQILVEAIAGGDKARSISNIMVLNYPYVNGEKYVAACIKEPKDFTHFSESSVHFDASTTRALEIVSGAKNYILPGSARLSWYWTFFWPGGEAKVKQFTATSGSAPYDFTVNFPVAGDNSATLTVELEDA